MDPYQQVKYWLDVIDYCSSVGFATVKQEQLGKEQAWADSTRWSFEFFSPAANPHSPENQVACSLNKFSLAR